MSMDIPSIPLGPPTLGIVNDDLTITFKRDLSHCSHQTIIVDAKARTVECGKCKKLMDPFDALGSLARDSTSLVEERAELRKDIERWRMEHDDAKRHRDNAIAARKRKEYPEMALLRELLELHKYQRCLGEKGDGATCGSCFLCRVRAVDARVEP